MGRPTVLFSALLVLLSIVSLSAAQRECTNSITKTAFASILNRFDNCKLANGGTRFQQAVNIFGKVYSLDGTFDKDGIDYAEISQFCMDASKCASDISDCEYELNDFIKKTGMALCENGQAKTQEIQEAIRTLTDGPCSTNYQVEGLRNDGCFMGKDVASMPTYLSSVRRSKSITSAETRCIYRYMDFYDVCPSNRIRALATLNAASMAWEQIGSDYESFTEYQKPSFSDSTTTLTMRGLSHLYNGERYQSTCSKLTDTLLLWNTYIKVDGSSRKVNPMDEPQLLTSIHIQFSNGIGQVVDSYMATSGETLPKRTLGFADTPIKVEVMGDKRIVLTHSEIDARVSVGSYGDGLSIAISLPTSLYDLETTGLLADGCIAYQGSDITLSVDAETSECASNCSRSSNDELYKDHCIFDCGSGYKNYMELYNSIEGQQNDVVRDINSGATQLSLSSAIVLCVCAVLSALRVL